MQRREGLLLARLVITEGKRNYKVVRAFLLDRQVRVEHLYEAQKGRNY